MIKLSHLSKHYAGASAPALDDISLTIEEGTIFGILGRSGAGKSTLLRCLNRLESPSSGRIEIDGQDLAALSLAQLRQQRQQMGMIFQHFNLLHSRNVQDNVDLALEIAGVPRAERRQRVASLLKLVGLESFASAWPSQLSGGQKQRVGIARALAARPRYLLCDEATSALDPETTTSILDLLADIQQQLNITVVLITHEMAVVKRICDGAAL
ncbi:methionine ABC transporter ATP-binding protein, partial [Pantoea sp. M_5]